MWPTLIGGGGMDEHEKKIALAPQEEGETLFLKEARRGKVIRSDPNPTRKGIRTGDGSPSLPVGEGVK